MAKALTQNEIDQMLRYIATKKMGYRDRVIFLMTVWSGMRIKEVACLRIRDVMNEDGTIKGEIKLTPEMTKGRHARVVFVAQKLKTELAQYLASRPTRYPDLPLFHSVSGKAFSANLLSQHFHWLYKNAGLSGASSHSGRKTFLTTLANKGISIHILASLAGHRNIAVTSRYLTANDELKRNAVELV